MIDGKKVLAIIPARGGSKRLPKKNILPLAGKPLIAWTIEAAKKSKYIDKIVVSSDDGEILNISKQYGVDLIERPDILASDTAKTVDVVWHVIQMLNQYYEYIILLQPTSPLRINKHIDESIEILYTRKADAVISVCEVEHPIEWCNILPKDLSLKNFISDDVINKRSQDLPKRYRLNGAIYIVRTEKFLEEKTFFLKDNIYAYIMSREDSIDIDDYIDFKLAEVILQERNVQDKGGYYEKK
ncbi:MAG: acylneuraminate cytidylyltransferase family protein [Candidatus Aenigmatarchaeota archaeon]